MSTTFTPAEIAAALHSLQCSYLEAQAETRQAQAAEVLVGQTLLRASHAANPTALLVRCARCGTAFVPVRFAGDDHAHCPEGNCGEPMELDALARLPISEAIRAAAITPNKPTGIRLLIIRP